MQTSNLRPVAGPREFPFGDERAFESCHASTLVALDNGSVLAAWFGGSRESNPDVAIWMSNRTPDGNWSEPRKVADEEGLPHWNPVVAQGPDGSLQLFYKVGASPRSWRTRHIRSLDGGSSWTFFLEPALIDGYSVGPVKNKPIILSDGAWVAPTSIETETEWNSAVTISRDHGQSWRLSDPVPINRSEFKGKGVIQPTLWESSDAMVHMLLRSTEHAIYRSDSADGGLSWTSAYPVDLPNNNSGIDLARLDSGLLALCYNPVAADWGKRTPLSIAFSDDDGKHWRDALVLEDDGADENETKRSEPGHRNEFSYPSIIASSGKFLVTYTWRRERICYREVTV